MIEKFAPFGAAKRLAAAHTRMPATFVDPATAALMSTLPGLVAVVLATKEPTMRVSKSVIGGVMLAVAALAAGTAAAQGIRIDRDGNFSFRFGRDDRRGDVEGKRASCEVYARIAVVQAQANRQFRCGLRGPAWDDKPGPHFQWCRYVPRRRIADEQRNRSTELQRCFDRLGDFDDDKWGR